MAVFSRAKMTSSEHKRKLAWWALAVLLTLWCLFCATAQPSPTNVPAPPLCWADVAWNASSNAASYIVWEGKYGRVPYVISNGVAYSNTVFWLTNFSAGTNCHYRLTNLTRGGSYVLSVAAVGPTGISSPLSGQLQFESAIFASGSNGVRQLFFVP